MIIKKQNTKCKKQLVKKAFGQKKRAGQEKKCENLK